MEAVTLDNLNAAIFCQKSLQHNICAVSCFWRESLKINRIWSCVSKMSCFYYYLISYNMKVSKKGILNLDQNPPNGY